MDTNHRIQFEKPDLPALTRQFTVVDLHFHTRYSDGGSSVQEVADYAAALGIGVAITDHNEIRGAIEIDRYPGLLTIPGIEITSAEGTHLLVYFQETRALIRFYERDILPHLGTDVMSSTSLEMEEIMRRARRYDTVIVFPHPYSAVYTGIFNAQFDGDCVDRFLAMADGVEVINAGNIHKWNLKSALLGFNLNKVITGGSDGHALPELGKVVTYAPCRPRRRDFLNALRRGENKVVGKEVALLRKVRTNGAKLRKGIQHYPDLIEKNIRYGCTVVHLKSQQLRETVRRRMSWIGGNNRSAV